MLLKRDYGRANNKVRPIVLKKDLFGYSDSSILYSAGNTKVLVSVVMQEGIPRFLRGQKGGWLTAEYSMLPCATHRRSNRESSQVYRNSRSVEISRLIGRVFRSVIDLSLFQEKTIHIDCDVLQADGSTRVACISAASLALFFAEKRWLRNDTIEKQLIKDEIAAVSVGKIGENFLLDLSFSEDSRAQADFNFVLSKSGKVIEIQGTAESQPISWDDFDKLKDLAINGSDQLFFAYQDFKDGVKSDPSYPKSAVAKPGWRKNSTKGRTPLFSLENRLRKSQ